MVHAINWDCVIFDEYHYGAWRDKAKDLFADSEWEKSQAKQQHAEEQEMELDSPDYFDEDLLPITTDHYLYLSGTPFRAINRANLLKSRFSTGRIPTSRKPKRHGKAITTLIYHCRKW